MKLNLQAALGLATIVLSTQQLTAFAQNATSGAPTLNAAPVAITATVVPGAVKTIWASGMQAPQGMARDAQGNIYVAEFRGGQVSKFSSEGKLLSTLGAGLKNPAWLVMANGTLYVSERKANRVLKLDASGNLVPVGDTLAEPLGMTVDNAGRVLALAHTTSQLMRLSADGKFEQVFVASGEDAKRYGYRCVAVDRDGSFLVTDETEDNLILITPAGRVSVWATGFDSPTAVVLSPRGDVYVAEEGAGRIARLDANGKATIVVDGLGKVRDIEFLDEKTLLASDQGSGRIWKVVLP